MKKHMKVMFPSSDEAAGFCSDYCVGPSGKVEFHWSRGDSTVHLLAPDFSWLPWALGVVNVAIGRVLIAEVTDTYSGPFSKDPYAVTTRSTRCVERHYYSQIGDRMRSSYESREEVYEKDLRKVDVALTGSGISSFFVLFETLEETVAFDAWLKESSRDDYVLFHLLSVCARHDEDQSLGIDCCPPRRAPESRTFFLAGFSGESTVSQRENLLIYNPGKQARASMLFDFRVVPHHEARKLLLDDFRRRRRRKKMGAAEESISAAP